MKFHLLFDYLRLHKALMQKSNNDEAALRCLRKKYEALQEDTHVSYMQAQLELLQEYNDCLPVDA